MRRTYRRLTGALVLASTLGLVPSADAQASPTIAAPVPIEQQRVDVLGQLNAERARAGQPRLTVHPLVQARSQVWADTIGATDTPEHDPDRDRILVQQGGCRVSAEVITGAGNSEHPAQPAGDFAVANWMNSPAHHDVILSNGLDQVGVGIVHVIEDASWWQPGARIEATYVVVQLASGCPTGEPVKGPPAAAPTPPNQLVPVVPRKTRTVRR